MKKLCMQPVVLSFFVMVMTASCGSDGHGDRNREEEETVPSPPLQVEASDGEFTQEIVVSWDPSTGAERYTLYRGTSSIGEFAVIADQLEATSYEDHDVESGTYYYYRVTASNGAGEGTPSGIERGHAGSAPALPDIPDGVDASDGLYPGGVVITWQEVPGAASYTLWRSTALNGEYQLLAENQVGTSFEDGGVAPGRYFYRVAAVSENGSGEPSEPEGGHRAITDLEFFGLFYRTVQSAMAKIDLLGKSGMDRLGRETREGAVGGTVSYNASFNFLTFRANIVLRYAGYCDFYPGNYELLVLDDGLTTVTDAGGNGTTRGTIRVSGVYAGSVRHDLVIRNQGMAGGSYHVRQNGGEEQEIPWDYVP